jgi:hypothetical protein
MKTVAKRAQRRRGREREKNLLHALREASRRVRKRKERKSFNNRKRSTPSCAGNKDTHTQRFEFCGDVHPVRRCSSFISELCDFQEDVIPGRGDGLPPVDNLKCFE